jgi:hypothetical protein
MPDFLDRLGDELLRAAQAPRIAPAAAPITPAPVIRLRGPARRRPRWLLGMLALLIAGAAAAAIATKGRPSPGPVPPKPGATLAIEPEPAQLAAFAILRRPRVAGDEIPEGMPLALSGASGANLGLARRAQGSDGAQAWVVPGRGSMCLISAWPERKGGGGACGLDSSALAGRLAVASGSAQAPSRDFLAGLVPDGVARVAVNLPGGHTITAHVRENVYLIAVPRDAQTVTFTGPRGPVTLKDVGLSGH